MARDITGLSDADKAEITRQVRNASLTREVWSVWAIDKDRHGAIVPPMVDIVCHSRGDAMAEAARFVRHSLADDIDAERFAAWCDEQGSGFATGATFSHAWPSGWVTTVNVTRG